MNLAKRHAEQSPPAPAGRTILLADDDSSIRTVLSQALMREGFRVRATPALATLWRWVADGEGDLVITDVYMEDENVFDLLPRIRAARPDLPVIVVSAQNNVLTAAAAVEHGAFDYLPKPFDLDQLLLAAQRAVARARTMPPALRERAGHGGPGPDQPLPMIGRSPAMQEVYRIIARVMNTDLTILLTGEPGTGKALTARLIHDLSRGRGLPYATIDLAGLSGPAAERALFGSEGEDAGGLLAGTRSGTLFLQSVDALGPGTQTRLSAWLAERERMLAAHPATFRAPRVIADAGHDLATAVTEGRFRSELYWRLNVVALRLPPLRERGSDVVELARAFLARHDRYGPNGPGANGFGKKIFEPGALEVLGRHSWPGNVRELENLVRRLSALTRGEHISAAAVADALELRPPAPPEGQDPEGRFTATLTELLPGLLAGQPPVARGGTVRTGLHDTLLAALERPLFRLVLARTRGNKVRAAEILGLNRNTFRTRLVALGLAGQGPVPEGPVPEGLENSPDND